MNKKLWIGTYFGGLDCFDGKNFTHYKHIQSDDNSLSDNSVWEILEDSKKRLWIGTLSGGLNLFNREHRNFPITCQAGLIQYRTSMSRALLRIIKVIYGLPLTEAWLC